MKILVACEYSGRVRDAFLKRGHEAISCDFLPTDQPGPHYQGDVRDILYNQHYDILIGHPPCTYLCNSGVHLLHKDPERWQKMYDGADFFKILMDAPIDRIAIENPVMHKYALERIGKKHTQTIQPYQFGHDASKRTCLWLKNLPPLVPTKIIDPTFACPCGKRFEYSLGKTGCPNCQGKSGAARAIWGNQTPGGQNKLGPSADRWKLRSTTYEGIAEAFAMQWS